MHTANESEIIEAIKNLHQKYGIAGLDNQYMLATDIDGDLQIAPVGLLDKLIWEAGGVNAANFIKIKDLNGHSENKQE